MCLIEQNKVEDAYIKLTNLQRSISVAKKVGQKLSARNQVIVQVLKTWLKNGGNKSLAKMKDSPTIKKLTLPKYRWDPLGSELIEFKAWFMDKV